MIILLFSFLISHSFYFISMQDISDTLFLPSGIVSFHLISMHVKFLMFCLNCLFPLLHFWAWPFLHYYSLCPRIVSLNFHASHGFYSSFLIAQFFYFISVHDSSLIFFITPRILSFGSQACHVSYSSILIAHSFNFRQFSYSTLYLLEFFHLISMHVTSLFF